MISALGVAGMAVGTAALVIVLSVFNGFHALVAGSLQDAGAPLVIRPAQGKVFVPEGEVFLGLLEDDRVQRLSSVLEEQAFVSFEGRQSLARVKGIDETARESSSLQAHLVDGAWQFYRGEVPQAVCGAALARTLGIHPRFVTPLEIHYPSRTEAVSLVNPAATLRTERVQLAGTVSVNAQLDASLLLVPIERMRQLLDYPVEVSALEIWPSEGSAAALQKELSARLGPSYRVLDPEHQDESVFRMMRYEKLAIYLILIFIVVIVAFNIYSALKMLIIEKQGDMETLRSLGAPEPLLRRVFLLEGLLVSLLGMVIGLAVGVAAVLLQQRFGLVPMPGNFAISAYPVALRAVDLAWVAGGVFIIGLLVALIPSRKLN